MYVGDPDSANDLWSARCGSTALGAQWRLLPAQYGKWNTVYQRCARRCDRGVWELMRRHFSAEPDLECLVIDSTVARAHQCAGGAPAKVVRHAELLFYHPVHPRPGPDLPGKPASSRPPRQQLRPLRGVQLGNPAGRLAAAQRRGTPARA